MNSLHRMVLATAMFATATAAQAANDLSVMAITAPLSGCALGSSEQVSIRLFNHGDELAAGTAVDVRYRVDEGNTINERIVLSKAWFQHGMWTHTFSVPADLSVAGSHRIAASVHIDGDINTGNDTLPGHIANHYARSAGGNLSGPDQAFSGTLILSGQVGDIQQWQQSTDGGQRWSTLDAQTETYAFDELKRTTQFRVEVVNGSCAAAYSAIKTVSPQ